MRFLCLIYTSADVDGTLTYSEVDSLIAEHFAYDESLRKKGTLILSDALATPDKAIVIRPRGSALSTTDGPFVETKEHLAGFYLVEAANMADATEIARRIPSGRHGAIEIRPIRILTLPGT
ncbi:YciI family protein [Rhizobium sp. LEGMi198b]|uniref:YciI family protein n=1 Tax=unclassified Rhizobium TaxID=2613769 RepID=UPI000CDF33E2|nr:MULTISPECIES: YciI family protein [Rhizobium]AVA20874.1 YciI-related domain-containing protein [Rhizobium sp. NXC24]UWU22081.1 YciI family protein [Rhizobium tropici]